ncbi:LAFA_0G14048g1_1 [Lachancea sp. 'fantastica']|nr:LAFA_0G14048g1_1 [Lachancea sp. 'fantastica']
MNIVVLSGGTAANALLPAFEAVSNELSFILPISDNGGSTSEILRVLGGPAIGDIRSRIVHLIKDEKLRSLLGYRLSTETTGAKQEWNSIVEGTHAIWDGLASEVKDICRSFLIHTQAEILKKHKSSAPFQFEKASVGNLFLTGVRLFLGSLDASIELALRVCRCDERTSIIPCINTNHTHHISALLQNGDVITGQSQISHPSRQQVKKNGGCDQLQMMKTQNMSTESLVGPDSSVLLKSQYPSDEPFEEFEDNEEYAYPGYIHPELKLSQLHFDKLDIEVDHLLPAAIKRIFYINPYGEEVLPQGNNRAVTKLKNSDMVVYSVGSLMTSLLPIIILGNIAETMLENEHARKVLLVNNKYDRETFGMDGAQFVQLIAESMNRALNNQKRRRKGHKSESAGAVAPLPWTNFVTDLVYLKYGEIPVDVKSLEQLGIRTFAIDSDTFQVDSLVTTLQSLQP